MVASSINSVHHTGNPYKDGLIWGNKWVDGSPVRIPYYFDDAYDHAWSGVEKAAVKEVLATYESITNVAFVQVNNKFDATFVFNKFNFDEGPCPTAIGCMLPPGEGGSYEGYGFFNQEYYWNSDTLKPGGSALDTMVHEIGHGLGLAHSHDDGGNSIIFPGVSNVDDTGKDGLNDGIFTVMSYNRSYSPAPWEGYGYVKGPMAFDIAVLHDIYGANTSTGKGNTVYELADNNVAGTGYEAIWDNGGTDWIKYGGSRDAVVNINEATLDPDGGEGAGGFLSYVSGIYGGYTIANGVTIENARTGGGDDVIVGNELQNVLKGGKGDDTIYGGAGNDMLFGQGDDDLLVGGEGDDNLTGNSGNDTLVGGDGRDTLKGGGGKDVFVLSGDGDPDVIQDLKKADRIVIGDVVDSNGQVFSQPVRLDLVTLNDSGGDTLIELQGVAIAIVENVDVSLFERFDWFA